MVTWSIPANPVPADAPEVQSAHPEVRLDTGLMPRHDHDVPRLLEAVRDLAGRPRDAGADGTRERRTGAPSSATDAPTDQDGPAPTRERGTGTDENDEEAP